MWNNVGERDRNCHFEVATSHTYMKCQTIRCAVHFDKRVALYVTHQPLVPPDEQLDVVGLDGASLGVLGKRLQVAAVLDQLQ